MKEFFSLTRIIVFSVVLLAAAFAIGYYLGNDNSRRATVVPEAKNGIVEAEVPQDAPTKECTFKIFPGNYSEPKALIMDKLKLVDIESYKVLGNKLFYSTGPVYGKPAIGIVDCASAIATVIVAAENTQGSYAYGSDFFRLKKITKELTANVYNIQYWYAPDIDKLDQKDFENDNHLKTFIYKLP